MSLQIESFQDLKDIFDDIYRYIEICIKRRRFILQIKTKRIKSRHRRKRFKSQRFLRNREVYR